MSVGADLLRFSNRNVLFWDLETSHLNLQQENLPFQCSFAVTSKRGVVSRHNYYLKWPNYRISEDAARITRFNRAWVENGTDPEFVLDAFESYLHDESLDVGGQNLLGFDVYVHQLWRRALGRKPDYSYLSRLYDTSALARAYKMNWKPDRANILAWQYRVLATPVKGVKTSLGLMGKELGMPVDETRLHEAGYDLEVNDFVYRKLINLVEI